MFETAIPILRVTNAQAAIDFYCQRLGFSTLSSWGGAEPDDPRYMTLGRDEVRLHIHSFPSGIPGAGAVYIFVDDVNSVYAELASHHVSLSTTPIDQEWGMREFAVRDPDGNVITFGQRRPTPTKAAT